MNLFLIGLIIFAGIGMWHVVCLLMTDDTEVRQSESQKQASKSVKKTKHPILKK